MHPGNIVGLSILGIIVLVAIIDTIRTLRPTERGLVERWGRFRRFCTPGIIFKIPFGIERLIKINITEMMVDVGGQEIITKDALNASVDAQVYFKVKEDEVSVKASEYNVYNYQVQIVALARTTLRNIIGTMNLMEANSDRDKINKQLYESLTVETAHWGIEIVRTELKEINPPSNVQEAMNKVVVASNEKTAAVDFATATETEADGKRRASIKIADGQREAKVLVAQGDAKAIELVNTAAQEFFKDQAVELKQLETVAAALQNNAKIVLPPGEKLINVIGDIAGVARK